MRVGMETERHKRSVHLTIWGRTETLIPTGRKSEAALSEICKQSLTIK